METEKQECPCKDLERLRTALKAECECYGVTFSAYAAREIDRLKAKIADLEAQYELNPACGGCEQCLERAR